PRSLISNREISANERETPVLVELRETRVKTSLITTTEIGWRVTHLLNSVSPKKVTASAPSREGPVLAELPGRRQTDFWSARPAFRHKVRRKDSAGVGGVLGGDAVIEKKTPYA